MCVVLQEFRVAHHSGQGRVADDDMRAVRRQEIIAEGMQLAVNVVVVDLSLSTEEQRRNQFPGTAIDRGCRVDGCRRNS